MTILEGYTRVSEIIAQWDRFGHIDPEVLARKTILGTTVHQAIDFDHNDIGYPLNDREEGYFKSYIQWKNQQEPKYVLHETRFYDHKNKITGQVDAIIKTDNGQHMLIDFKTSANASPKFWCLQAGLYHMLCMLNNEHVCNRVQFIQLDKNGQYPSVHEYEITDHVREVCEAAIKTYRYIHS